MTTAALAPRLVPLPRAEGVWTRSARRLVRHRGAMVGLTILAALAVFCVAGPWFVPYEPDRAQILDKLQSPNPTHWFGTDQLGRDTLVRVMHGGRVSLFVGLVVAVASALIGSTIGALSGYFGGLRDNVAMRVVDLVQSIPRIVLLLVFAKLVPPGVWSIVLILMLLEWTGAARLVRGMVLSLRHQQFVEAARAIGCRDRRVIFGHALPNSLSPLIVETTLLSAAAIRAEATLSFLGLGIQSPDASWGNLLSGASTYMLTAPWQVYIPGVFIFVTLMSLNLLGDGLRDALDPRTRERR